MLNLCDSWFTDTKLILSSERSERIRLFERYAARVQLGLFHRTYVQYNTQFRPPPLVTAG